MLSICIPTYKRAAKLELLLKSLAEQCGPKVEICISDNGSLDGTREIVALWKDRLNIVYFEWAENVGFDSNLKKVVDLAHGEYCWLLGSDDVAVGGAVSRLLAIIEQYKPPGLFVGFGILKKDCAINLQCSGQGERDVQYRNLVGEELLKETLNFGFLSRQVFQKILWDEAAADGAWQNCIGGGYLHLYMMMRIALQNVKMWYADETVYLLYNIDSFSDQVVATGSVHNRLLNEVQQATCIFREICSVHQFKQITRYWVWGNLLRDLVKWRLGNVCFSQKCAMHRAVFQMLAPRFVLQGALFLVVWLPLWSVHSARYLFRIVAQYKNT